MYFVFVRIFFLPVPSTHCVLPQGMYSQATIFVLSLSLLTTYCCCCCFLSFYCCCYSIYKRLKSDSVKKKKFSLVQNLSLLSRYLKLLYTRLVELDVVSSYTFFFSFPQSAFETNLYNSTWRETPVKRKRKKKKLHCSLQNTCCRLNFNTTKP